MKRMLTTAALLMMAAALLLTTTTQAAHAEGVTYYCTDGGLYMHGDPNCASVNPKYCLMQPIDAGDAYTKGLKPCMVCLSSKYYMVVEIDVYHQSDDCPLLLGAAMTVHPCTWSDVLDWQLEPCAYCVNGASAEDLRQDERWYDPQGGLHFHRGGTPCPLAASGAFERRKIAAVSDGFYITELGRKLLPCYVCMPYGENGKLVQYQAENGSRVLHTSAYCPEIAPAYRATRVQPVPYDTWDGGLDENLQLCRLCMGVDDQAVYAWYNTQGGKKLHRNDVCSSMSIEYHAYVVGVVETEAKQLLNHGMNYCSVCWGK